MSETQAFPTTPEYGAVPQYPIESVDNALRVLVLLGERPQLRLTDVSQYLGVASSTAHRVLAMLCYRGLVRQNAATRSYEPGPSLDQLAFGLLRRLDVRSRARPTLEKLNADLQETVHLGRLEGAMCTSSTPSRAPGHCAWSIDWVAPCLLIARPPERRCWLPCPRRSCWLSIPTKNYVS